MNIAQQGAEEEPSQRPSFLERLFGGKSVPEAPIKILPQADQFADNLQKLKDTRISDIATPRAEIEALPVDADMETFFEVLREHGYSRIPVYRETLDDAFGLIHVKDVFMTYGSEGAEKNFSLEPFVRNMIVVPPSMRVLTLLQKMQTEHVHMAMVIDEFGGVDGLVTIEDIIEEIVGEITDEHDETEDFWKQEKPGVYLARATSSIEEFEAEVGITFPQEENEDDIDTIGGLVMTLATRVPVKGEVIKHESGFEFEIVDADPRRIKRIRIYLPQTSFEDIK